MIKAALTCSYLEWWMFCFVFVFFLWRTQFYLCKHRLVLPQSVKGRQGGCINRSCRPIIVKMPTALCGESWRPHSSRPCWKEQKKEPLQLSRHSEEKGANLMRNVLEWIRNNRSRSKGDNLPKAGFSELLNILLNNFVSVAFKNPTNKTSILLKIEVVRTKITFKGGKRGPFNSFKHTNSSTKPILAP